MSATAPICGVYRDYKVNRLAPLRGARASFDPPLAITVWEIIMGVLDPALEAVLTVTAALFVKTIWELRGDK
jgi:hypothetical protein